MRVAIRAAFVVVASAAAALAGINSAIPWHLTPGATMQIEGSGFSSKPTARLVVGKRRIALKIDKTTQSDTHLAARLVNVPPGVSGDATLEVLPHRSKTPIQFTGLTIKKPQITTIEPASGGKGATLTIKGGWFGAGAKTGKPPAGASVKIGRTRAAIVSWIDSEVVVKVPKMKNGVYDVTVADRAGADVRVGGFTYEAVPSADEYVQGGFGGQSFGVATASSVLGERHGSLTAVVRAGSGDAVTGKAVVVNVTFNPAGPFPLKITTGAAYVSYDASTNGAPTERYQATNGSVEITIASCDNMVGGRIVGSFKGTLQQVGFGTMDTSVQCSGVFAARFDD